MTNFTVTIDANFSSGNTMAASHWTTAIDDVETLLQGVVGRDGAGIDNWNGNEALRGLNFRKNGLVGVVHRFSAGPIAVIPSTNITTGDGVSPSPIPGGLARFHLRAAAAFVLVHFQGRMVWNDNSFDLSGSWDNGTPAVLGLTTSITTNQSQMCRGTWLQTSSIGAGWHTVEHRATRTGSGTISCVFDQTELIVLAAYA
jgi:hypothetical protein